MQKINDGQDTVVESGQDLGDLANGDTTSIFTQGNITPPVAAILDVPVVANQCQELLG